MALSSFLQAVSLYFERLRPSFSMAFAAQAARSTLPHSQKLLLSRPALAPCLIGGTVIGSYFEGERRWR
jgi:hypothetical protein